MKALGAILAGGKAQRFGSDKAAALWRGRPLIDWVADALEAQCEAVVLCGRQADGFVCLTDAPEAGLGPLGGLNAALRYASLHGYTHVLSAGVDAPNLPPSLRDTLAGPGAAIVANQPVVGLWPSALRADLDGYLADGGRALYGFAESVEAQRVTLAAALLNINHPNDLEAGPAQ